MPNVTPNPTLRHTEEIARETATGLFLECLPLMRATEPGAWEMAAKKFSEAAGACQVAVKALAKRKAQERISVSEDGPIQARRIVLGDEVVLCDKGALAKIIEGLRAKNAIPEPRFVCRPLCGLTFKGVPLLAWEDRFRGSGEDVRYFPAGVDPNRGEHRRAL